MSRVFVVQDMGFDYGDAEQEFGELVFLLERKEASIFNTARVTALIKKRLWDYGFNDNDYLLAVGAPAAMIIAGVEAHRLSGHGYRVLQWDKEKKRYYSIDIRRT